MNNRAIPMALAYALAALVSASVLSAPVTPIYMVSWDDAVTGNNRVTDVDGKQRWTVDATADSYPSDYYERPTAQEYKVYTLPGGVEIFAAKEYYEYLDIVQGRAGYDADYLYISIELFGHAKHTEDNTRTIVGLNERYGFRIGKNPVDPESAFGYRFYVDQVGSQSNPTVFSGLKAFGYHDTDGDVGGTSIATPNEGGGTGYDLKVVSDGTLDAGPGQGTAVLWSRISPINPNVVEFALAYSYFGYTISDLQTLPYLVFEAIDGGPIDSQNFLWNDKYSPEQAGSPYRATSGDTTKSIYGTQGLGNLYELDTLMGGGIPEPSAALLAGAALCLFTIRRRRS